MTAQELCSQYKISMEALKTHFSRVQKNFLRDYNLTLTKKGRGDNTEYYVLNASAEGQHALTMAQEARKEVIMSEEGFSHLLDFNFLIFLGVCMTPMTTFYGSYEQFLDYVQVKRTKANITALKEGLEQLHRQKYLQYVIDDTNNDYFWAGIYFSVKQEMAIGVGMIERCRKLAAIHNKKSWIPLLKTWLGMQYMYDKQPFTIAELTKITGLSAYQIRESKKILEKDELFITSKAYAAYNICIGTKVDLNGIYKENREYAWK